MDGYDDLAVVSEPEGWDVRVFNQICFGVGMEFLEAWLYVNLSLPANHLAGFSVSATEFQLAPRRLHCVWKSSTIKSFKTLEIEEFVPEF